MTFDQLWTAFYSLFRADSDVPVSGDDEYTVGMRLANEAVNRWAFYDSTYWKELFTTAQIEEDGDITVVAGQTDYEAPASFQEAGGFIKIINSDGNVQQVYPILEPQEAQFKVSKGTYAYFTGSPALGMTLNLNPAPSSALDGMDIDYVYYKQPTLFTTGTDVTEMADPYFIVHRMLYNQFRAARNPYLSSAKSDAENALRQMQLDNNSGNWSEPPTLADNSGTTWGN